ncbi:hypothetical protein ACFL5K_02435 [Gemmatimonadota bacterium]
MRSLLIIPTIALYESRVLLRSWFFRIFALLALILLTLLNLLVFVRNEVPWMFNGMPSYIPYLNMLLLNVVQAVIGVFMASDFLKYDRKLDTTEVIYMRSMTNADYVLGKMLGVLSVFAGLNLLMLLIGLLFNAVFSDLPVLAAPYLWYPLLISLPTVLFIFGLTFMLMVIVRNQAVTFILLLAYIFSTLFYLGFKYHYLFDYMAFNVPLMYSEVVGFGDLSRIIAHRGIYFLLGLGFTFTTVLLLRRLPQSRVMNRVSLVLAVFSIGGAFLLGKTYIERISEEAALRAEIVELNKQICKQPTISLDRCGLELTHAGERIEVEARLAFTNNTPAPLDRYIFSLNPGLEVGAVTRNGQDIPFARNLHILYVEPPSALDPGAMDSVTVSYRGAIDERACYPDIDEEARKESYRIVFYNIAKRFAFMTPDYVLLTPETLWYPIAGLSEGAAYPEIRPRDFIDFTLRVKTAEGLRAVSQGAVTDKGGGEFVFSPETPLPQLSLAIGRYELHSLTVEDSLKSGDSTIAQKTDYNLYYLEGHDFFSQYFTEVADTLPSLIRDARADYENKLNLEYPYRRLSLVETPIQFFAYSRDWTMGTEALQPELVLMPEKAVAVEAVNFKMMSHFMGRRGRRGGVPMSEEEIQRGLFQRFVGGTFLEGSSHTRGMMGLRRRNRGLSMTIDFGNFSVFPLYHSQVRHFSSAEWPIFNMAMEYYLNDRVSSQTMDFLRFIVGLSNEEHANLALMERSLAEILENPGTEDDIYNIMRIKGAYLFNYIKSEVGEDQFENFLKDFLDSGKFIDKNAEDFVGELAGRFGVDFAPHFDSWLHGKQLPAFIFTGLEAYQIVDEDRTRYQVLFKVSNPEPVDGLVGVNFRSAGGGRGDRFRGPHGGGMGSDAEDERVIMVKAGQSKEIGLLLDEEPRAMRINTFVSQNLPTNLEMRFDDMEPKEGAKPFEGERLLDQPLTPEEPGEIIVDNEDPGFEVHAFESESFLKKLLKLSNDDNDQYIGVRFWKMPARWRMTPISDFYGQYRHSAHYIGAGDGENRVSWKTELPGSGEYDVYYYVTELSGMWRRGRRGRNQESPAQDFHFTINHDDGSEELKIDMDGAEQGWYLLGTFYFSSGATTVELTDQSKGRVVYADAVKWARHD